MSIASGRVASADPTKYDVTGKVASALSVASA
jgi:hypothetical protein